MAIVLDVLTKVTDSSLRSSSDQIEKHFTKSGQKSGEEFAKALSTGMSKSPELERSFNKVADLTGKVRVEQEKLNAVNDKASATDAQKIAQAERLAKAQRDLSTATNSAARSFESANTSAGGMLSTLSNLTSGTRFGGMISQVDTLAARFGGMGMAAGGAIAGIAALGVAAVAAGKQLYDLGKQWDDVSDSITARTGKVGDELKSITDQVGVVAGQTASSISDLGNIAGQTVQSMHLSGLQLAAMTETIAELNNLTGETTNIRQLAQVYRMFGVDAKDQVGILNALYTQFQRTGIPVNDLINTLQTAGPVLSDFFNGDIVKATGFLSVFESAGISADAAIKGLKASLKKFAEAGVDPKLGLQQTVTEIRRLIEAGDIAGARDLAESRFGKGFPEILRAIKENRLEIEKLPDSIDQITPSIDNATKATEDFSEQWQKFKNQLSADLKPAADAFFSWMNDQLESLLVITGKFSKAWKEWANADWWHDSAFGRALSALGLGPKVGNTPGGGGGSWGGSDSDLLSHVPAGRYLNANEDQSQADLTKGLGDCTSAIEDLINIMNGQPTAGRSMSTANADEWLTAHGFVPTNEYVPGSFNVGFNDHHMQATLPGGTEFNWGSDSAAAAGGIAGGGAFDPSQGFTKHYYLPADPVVGLRGTPGSGAYSSGKLPGTSSYQSGKGAPVGPGLVPSSPSAGATGPAVGSFTPGNFPAAGDVAPASPVTAPVQMVPSPFGPQYGPVPAGSTPGYSPTGKPGYYLPDPDRIASQTDQYQSSLDRITDAGERIEDAKQRQLEAAQKQAEVEADITSTAEDRARAAKEKRNADKALDDAVKAANRANTDAAKAEKDLAEAKLGAFHEAQSAQKAKADKNELGGPLADDFGLSEGLPGLAKWLTTFAMNLAMAPALGAMQATANASPYQGGYGMFGMMGANNLAAGLTPLGLSSGAAFTPGAAAIGPAPLGGGIPSMVPGLAPVGPGVAPGAPGAAAAGPSVTSQAPSAGPGGGGFTGFGGSMFDTVAGAAAMAAPALDAMAPGAGQAAKTGVQLANRTIGYIGQLAGIGVSGVMETLLPHGSEGADPNKSWVGKIASGVAGARPALPNTAGGQNPAGPSAPPQTPEQAQSLQAQTSGGQSGGPMVHVENMNNYSNDGGQSISNQIARTQMSSYMSGMPR